MIDVKTLAQGVKKFTVDNSPSILTAVAVAGVISTAIFAVKGTAKAVPQIMHAESEQIEGLNFIQKTLLTWKCYIPALGMGAVTIACIVSANSVSTRRNAALVSVYTVTEKAFKEYKEKVVETIGENKERAVRDEIAQDQVDKNPVSNNEIYITGSDEELFYDSLTARYFKSGMEKIRKAQNDLNARILSDMYASQNDFYMLIGLPLTDHGDLVGWTTSDMLDISFSGTITEDGKPCIAMNYAVQPKMEYHKSNQW